MFALFLEFGARTLPQDLWLFLVSETGLNCFSYEPKAKFVPATEPARSTAGSCEEILKWLILPAGNACKTAYSTQN